MNEPVAWTALPTRRARGFDGAGQMNANELTDMNVNKLADDLERASSDMEYNIHVSDWALLFESAVVLRQQHVQIEALERSIEALIEKQSHHEAMAHAGGFEAGRELGMKQERALWELAASTQEIEK